MKILKSNLNVLNHQFFKDLVKINKHTFSVLCFALISYCLYAQNSEVANGFGLGSRDDGYYTIEEINTKMDELAANYQNICQPKFSIGTTTEGRPIYAFKISDNPNVNEPEPAVYYDAAHHGNEKIAMAVTINYMMWLCEQYGSNDEVTYLIDNREMYFVPVVNVDGYIKNTRKNRNISAGGDCQESDKGVDLNRNYSIGYGSNSGSSSDGCAFNYRGSSAFSEQETQAVRDFVRSINPACAFSIHAPGGFVLMPSGFSEIPTQFNLYADLASEMYTDNNYYYATTATSFGYVSSGTTRDYLNSLGIVAYTPEVRPPGRGIVNIKNVVAENVKPMRTLAWLSGAFPVVKYHQIFDDILPGSDFNMLVALKNKGQEQTGNSVNVSVTPSNDKITRITGTIGYLNIESQMLRVNSPNPFRFRVSDDAQTGDKVNLLIKVLVNGVQTDSYTVPVVVGKKNILLEDNAERSTMNWTVSGAFGNEAGTSIPSLDAWGRDNSNSYSGTYSFSDSKNGLASTNQSAYFTTNSVNLNTSNIVKVQFAAKWSFGNNDEVKLQVNSNNSGWTNLKTYTQSSDWIYNIIDLSAYNEGSLKLRFGHTSNNVETGDGFYFDDFEIVEYKDPTDEQQAEVEWDSAPSACDDNNKRSIGVKVFNISAQAQLYKITVYNGNTFVHGSSEINVEANSEKVIVLNGIPAGTYTVKLEKNESPYDSREFTFESCTPPDESPCEIRDKEALTTLYNATGRTNWTITWNLNAPIDTWHGVSLNNEGCVTGLKLINNNLTGQIPSQLANLTELTSLVMYTNKLSGEIPAVLGNLSRLKTLHLSHNKLVGEIPGTIGDLDNLELLNLSNNDLSGSIPGSVGNLNNLNKINLINNSLSGCYDSNLRSLCNINDSNLINNGNSLPDWDAFCVGSNVDLCEGPQEDAEVEWDNAPSVCDDNNKRSIGVKVFNTSAQTQLYKITVYNGNTFIHGSSEINVEPNEEKEIVLNGIPTGTYTVNLEKNESPYDSREFTFEFCTPPDESPCEIRDKEALTALYNATGGTNWTITWNLTDDIDTWFGVSLNTEGCVTGLKLVNNNLTGQIPTQLENLTELSRLIMYTNNLTGGIPAELGSLTNLKILHLSHNDISGEIPGELGMLKNMELFNLSNNQLSGNLPPQLYGINENGALRTFKLTNNNLTGCYYAQFRDAFCNVNTVAIDTGNGFDSSWENFCTEINGNCIDRRKKASLLYSYNYPNPFKQKSIIFFNLYEDSEVSIKVYNATGDEIEVLLDNSKLQKGENTVSFNGTNYPVGIYYYSIQNSSGLNVYKMTLIK